MKTKKNNVFNIFKEKKSKKDNYVKKLPFINNVINLGPTKYNTIFDLENINSLLLYDITKNIDNLPVDEENFQFLNQYIDSCLDFIDNRLDQKVIFHEDIIHDITNLKLLLIKNNNLEIEMLKEKLEENQNYIKGARK